MRTRSENVKRNIIWGVLNSIVVIVLPFITRTVIIYSLGIEYNGLNSLFQSVLQALSFAELGVGSAMVFSMYKPMAEGDKDQVCALLNFYRKCYRIIGLIICVIGLTLLPVIDNLIAGEVPDGLNVKLLFLIYIIDNIIGYMFFIYKSSLFNASQRVDYITKITIFVQIIKTFAQIFVIIVWKNYYLYVAVLPLSTFLNNIIIGYCSKTKFPEYECRGELQENQIKTIKSKIGGMFFQKIGSIILSSADTIIISAFLGLKVLGIYNGYYYIITALTTMLGVIHRSLIPSVGNSIVKEDKIKNYNDFKNFNFLYIWIISWCSVCLVCLFQPFILLWQGTYNMLPFTMVILFAVYFFTFHMADMSHIYKESLGLWWEGKFIPLISSILNLTLNLILVNLIGLSGILISTIISVMFVNAPFVAYIVFKYYFKSTELWLEYLAKLLQYFIVTVIVAVITYSISNLIPFNGINRLISIACLCLILPNILFWIIYSSSTDFKNSMGFLLKILPERISRSLRNFLENNGRK